MYFLGNKCEDLILVRMKKLWKRDENLKPREWGGWYATINRLNISIKIFNTFKFNTLTINRLIVNRLILNRLTNSSIYMRRELLYILTLNVLIIQIGINCHFCQNCQISGKVLKIKKIVII